MENYRPISIFPSISEVYERLVYDHLYPYFDEFFSKLQCGFRKGYNAEQWLMSVIKKWWKTLNASDHAGTLLIDLHKTFDSIDHELLQAKRNAYDLDIRS